MNTRAAGGIPGTTRRLPGLCERQLEPLAQLVLLEAGHREALRAGGLTARELDVGLLHAQRLGKQGDTGRVGPTLLGRGGDPHLEGVAVASDHRRATRSGLHMEPDDGSAVALNVEKFIDHDPYR